MVEIWTLDADLLPAVQFSKPFHCCRGFLWLNLDFSR